MKNEKRLIILEIILVIITLIAMIFNKNITRQIFAVILLIYMIINKILIKTDNLNLSIGEKTLIENSKIYIYTNKINGLLGKNGTRKN